MSVRILDVAGPEDPNYSDYKVKPRPADKVFWQAVPGGTGAHRMPVPNGWIYRINHNYIFVRDAFNNEVE